ncbi:hypothetical protein OIU34_24535 [Pararhizobium sp. BT-229]|uniref:hypothetical protein n=1 Tax=Pararhizobium sp. BT-229 TaxID=2986923 RepID=UPI0021F6E951|nr:hypothetical protein [Pararhizobium sp. BT-229]MCV9965069.1 hypothetical protein [Pararhizobium sp. BT-229]
MSQSQKTPVSEVIGNTESFIHRVIDIRRRAAELSEQAARLQEEAYLAAVRDLGTEDGPMAFALACRGLGVDPALRWGFKAPATGSVEQAPPAATPVAPAVVVPAAVAPVVTPHQAVAPVSDPAPSRAAAAPRAAAVERPAVSAVVTAPVSHQSPSTTMAEQDDPSRLIRYGVAIKRSKLAEAEEVIDQARRTAAQNRKANPYSDDRGRNAWRNTLFAAVLAAESGHDDEEPPVVRNSDTPVAADTEAWLSEEEIHDSDEVSIGTSPVEDAFPPQAELSDGNDGEDDDTADEDDVLDDSAPHAEPVAPSVVLPSRAVAFTNNPVQSAPKSDERAPAHPPMGRQTSPFSRAVPAPAPSTPEVHVDRPVQNRTVAHGQAVPMPKSLKDVIRKIDGETPSTPTITPPPLRRAPSFVPRS